MNSNTNAFIFLKQNLFSKKHYKNTITKVFALHMHKASSGKNQ